MECSPSFAVKDVTFSTVDSCFYIIAHDNGGVQLMHITVVLCDRWAVEHLDLVDMYTQIYKQKAKGRGINPDPGSNSKCSNSIYWLKISWLPKCQLPAL